MFLEEMFEPELRGQRMKMLWREAGKFRPGRESNARTVVWSWVESCSKETN